MDEVTAQPLDCENPSATASAALRSLEQRAQAALAAHREHALRLESQITNQIEQIAATLNEQTNAEATDTEEAGRLKAELEASRATWAAERRALEAAWADERKSLETARMDERKSLESTWANERRALESAWENERKTHEAASAVNGESLAASWADERVTLEAARDALTQQVAKLEADQRQTREAWQKQLLDFEQKLSQQYSAWNEQRTAWSQEREGLEREREELRQKFELALEDVHRFRGRIAELEQELSRRPETIEADSAELVALRAERSALSERVEQLERQPAAQNDPNSEQQVADLQRRFELAVEDVRELKTKNARLEAQVASAGKCTVTAVDVGGTDWESQKRRLLESLEGTDESQADPVRQKERVTIESTIEMTDSIVAQKDREIADLKTQLAASGNAETGRAAEEHDQQIRELMDADEVIVEHRKRIAQFEREMEDKLRAAELELSIERAKIARQNAELDDMRAELQSERRAYGDHGLPAGAPRRRWLSKLGLSGEEQSES